MIQHIPGEEWRDIAGYESMYRVSNMGRVMSLLRKDAAILKPLPNNTGYPQVGLRKGGYRKALLIHRLVMAAFEPIPNPELFDVNHKNMNTADARLENLEWCTRQENMAHYLNAVGIWPAPPKPIKLGPPNLKHRFGVGRIIAGPEHHLSKLTDADVIEIRRLSAEKPRQNNAIARQFEIGEATVRQIVSGQTWRHLL